MKWRWFCAIHLLALGLIAPVSAQQKMQAIQIEDLEFEVFKGNWNRLPDFDQLKPTRPKAKAPGNKIDVALAKAEDFFAIRFTGKLVVRESGKYIFFLDSDDGSQLKIGGKSALTYDGLHGVGNVQINALVLTKGSHPLELVFFEKTGEQTLHLWALKSGHPIFRLSRRFPKLLHHVISQSVDHQGWETLYLLLKSGIEVNEKDDYGITPLCLAAAEKRSLRGVKMLLHASADPNIRDGHGRTPAHLATINDDNEILNELISFHANLLLKDDRGEIPLQYALRKRELTSSFVKLVRNTPNVEKIADESGNNLLHWVAENRITSRIQKLIEMGIRIDARNNFGETALHMAAWNGDEALVETLLDQRADPNAVDAGGTPPIYLAAWKGHLKVVGQLVKHGARFKGRGRHALHAAAWNNHLSTVKTLLELAFPVDAKDSDGNSALHKAAWQGNTEIARALVRAGADKKLKNNAGMTPQDVARSAGKRGETVLRFLATQ